MRGHPRQLVLASALKVLHCPLMSFGRLSATERPQIATLAGLGILHSGVQPVFSGFQFTYHARPS